MAGISGSAYQEAEQTRQKAAKEIAQMMLPLLLARLALAVASAIEAYRMQKRSHELQLNIMNRQLERLKMFWPYELQQLAEFGVDEPTESVEAMGRRYAGRLVPMVAGKYANLIAETRCNAPKYCTSANEQNMMNLYIGRAIDEAGARVQGRQIAFTEYQDKRSTVVNRRIQTVALGNGLGGQAVTFASQSNQYYQGQMAAAMQGVSGALAGIANNYTSTPAGLDATIFHSNSMQLAGGTGYVAPFGNSATFYNVANGMSSPLDAGLQGSNYGIVNSAASRGLWPASDAAHTAVMERDWFNEGANHGDAAVPVWYNIVRAGQWTFPVIGITGGSVIVDLERYITDFQYADDMPVKGTISGLQM